MLQSNPNIEIKVLKSATADDITSNQTIAKPNVVRRFDNAFTPPFRLGKKQKRAILDANGIEVIIMPHNNENQAQMYCDYLNGV